MFTSFGVILLISACPSKCLECSAEECERCEAGYALDDGRCRSKFVCQNHNNSLLRHIILCSVLNLDTNVYVVKLPKKILIVIELLI